MAVCQRLHSESTRQLSSQIEPALRGPDIGDIPGPHLIGLYDREQAIECVAATGMRHRALFLDGFGPNPFSSQEPGHAMLTNRVPPA